MTKRTPTPRTEVNCGDFIVTLVLDHNSGDSVPVLRLEQDGEMILLDAGSLQPFIAALQDVQDEARL